MIAGVIASRKGLSKPIGSLTQTGHIELADGKVDRYPLIKYFVPLASLEDVVFGGWDNYEDNVYQAASQARVLACFNVNADLSFQLDEEQTRAFRTVTPEHVVAILLSSYATRKTAIN